MELTSEGDIDGQLAAELEDMGGEGGWRLSLVRLVERDRIPEIQAVCVVSKARAKRGKVLRMRALAVQEELRARGLAVEAIRRLQEAIKRWGGWLDQSTSWWLIWLPV